MPDRDLSAYQWRKRIEKWQDTWTCVQTRIFTPRHAGWQLVIRGIQLFLNECNVSYRRSLLRGVEEAHGSHTSSSRGEITPYGPATSKHAFQGSSITCNISDQRKEQYCICYVMARVTIPNKVSSLVIVIRWLQLVLQTCSIFSGSECPDLKMPL